MTSAAQLIDGPLPPARLRRWRHIRATAVALFDQHGYAVVSIDEITEAAGVSRRTFFNYFATKGGVLFDPDPEEAQRLSALLQEGAQELDPWASLVTALEAYLELQEELVTARRRIIDQEPSLDAVHMMANANFEQSVLNWLAERGVEGLRAHVFAAVALGVVRAAFRTWDPDDGYQAFLASLREGLGVVGMGMR
ncbi:MULTISPECIES: TetR/AcrR family transcriptional regulator [unclassified Pseudoclavibacter]|uniref:TetR/AcrR family transcriptional regulator n=1 Tax=unclassified Pseudoclavibacter TaxID=2615177 RepID=UPI0015E36704|nr:MULTISPECIES: TetR/AcrR family transcriptional regulator [unclassified Pseudoclavibacter]